MADAGMPYAFRDADGVEYRVHHELSGGRTINVHGDRVQSFQSSTGPLQGHERLETRIVIRVMMGNENLVYGRRLVACLDELVGYARPHVNEVGFPVHDQKAGRLRSHE